MAYPALFRHLFGDNPVRPFKFRKELIPLDVDKFNQWYDQMETWRKSLIGCLIPTTMATLPSCLGIPDGSLFLFEDYPELQEKYASGGFEGMLLESTATSEEKDAWRGKWIKHPQDIGLYSPRLSGLFLRNAGDLAAAVGRYQQDAVQTGISRIIGRQFAIPEGGKYTVSIQGNVSSITYDEANLTLVASSSGMLPGYQQIVNQRMADETRPSNATILCGIYLGCPAEV